jgi:Arc/MetJ-type ribon-helix-helix transcriptional regulator
MGMISVRVPDEWKSSMDAAGTNWSEFIRTAIRWKLDQLSRRSVLDRLAKLPGTRRPMAAGTGVRSVREDRDAG